MLCLLALLMVMDSFKLVPIRFVVQALAAGAAAALVALVAQLQLIDALGVPIPVVTRVIAPVVEELLKLLFVIYAVRCRRVGFPVDAAIVGFAVGTGFALVENTYYLLAFESAGVLLWLVRGFGAAILHGAATAIAAIIAQSLASRRPAAGHVGLRARRARRDRDPRRLQPVRLSAGRRDAAADRRPAAAGAGDVRPQRAVDARVDERRARSRRRAAELVLSEDFGQTRLGAYLHELRSRFPGPVVADMFCLMRVELELGIRAKGMLMAREAGLDVPLDDECHGLAEVRYLEKAIGPTGLLALTPLQVSSDRDAWHKFLLREQKQASRNP